MLSISSHILSEFPTLSTKVRVLALYVANQMGGFLIFILFLIYLFLFYFIYLFLFHFYFILGSPINITPAERTQANEQCIYELKQKLNSNIVPIGMISSGSKIERALLL